MASVAKFEIEIGWVQFYNTSLELTNRSLLAFIKFDQATTADASVGINASSELKAHPAWIESPFEAAGDRALNRPAPIALEA